MRTRQTLMTLGRRYLAAHRVPHAARGSERLLEFVLGEPRVALYAEGRAAVSRVDLQRYLKLLRLRARRIPIPYLTGEAGFMELALRVSSDVLVPRPETEELVERLLAEPLAPELFFCDVGTGSGAIALAIAHAMPYAHGVALDCCSRALAVARENAARLGLQRRVQVVESDLFGALDAHLRFDLVVSNPPYLCSGELAGRADELAHEPRLALDGGARGTDVLARLIPASTARLRPGGLLAVEIGYDQGPVARRLAEGAGFRGVLIEKDLAGLDRMLIATH